MIEGGNSILYAKFAQDRPKWKDTALREQLKKANKEIANLINAIKVGIITDTVRDQLMNAEKKKKEIELFLSCTTEEVPKAAAVTSSIVSGYITDMHAMLSLHPVYGKTLLSRIIDKILVEPLYDTAGISVYCKEDGILEGKSLVTTVAASHLAVKSDSFNSYLPDTLAA